MRSIFSAFVWDTLRQGRWRLPIGILGGNGLSILLFATLFGKGVPVTQGGEFVLWHLVASQLNAFAFGVVLIGAQGNPQRFFTLPITNQSIVAYYLLIGMGLMFAESVLSAILINALFGAGWPLWGPALFSAVSLAVIYATLWVADRSFWLIANLIVVASAGGVWYRFRHGPFFMVDLDRDLNQLHFWNDVTIVELLTLAAAALIAYGVAVVGLGWRRRGEDALSVGFVAWATRWLEPRLEVGPPFRSPTDAHHWFESRKKASIIPAILILGMVFGLIFWSIFNRDPRELFTGLYNGGCMSLIVIGFLGGFIYGNVGSGEPSDGDMASDMGHFLGTRPLTSKGMANVLLKVAFRGVVTGWLMWIASVALLYLILLAFGAVDRTDRADPNALWGSLLASWMAAGVGLCVLLLGRPRALVFLALGTVVSAIAWLIGTTFFVPLGARDAVETWTIAIVGSAGIVVTGTAFALAWRREMISTATAIGGLVLWSLLSALAVWMAYRTNHFGAPIASILFVTGIASLAAMPLAAAPLALSWNRVR